MECTVLNLLDYGRRTIVLGQVVQMHVRDDCLDERRRYVRPDTYQPIARLHADNYIVSDNQFVLAEPEGVAPPSPASAADALIPDILES
jgi:flavin reductase (DIM6/NTAB) family NADH-FMN oxidoreductase RutF